MESLTGSSSSASISSFSTNLGHFAQGLVCGFTFSVSFSGGTWFQAGEAVGVAAAVGILLTGPEDPVADDLALVDASRTAEDAGVVAKGWRAGDPIDALNRAGNEPAWSTVRGRYWKNVANDTLEGEWSDANLARTQGGLAPLHDELGVPMELHHIVPRWAGGGNDVGNLEALRPWEHAAVDPFRFYAGPTP